MKYSLEFGGSPQDLTMTLSGAADARGIRALMEEMSAHPDFRPGLLILADLSALDTSTIGTAEYESISHLISGRDHSFPPLAIAIVAPEGPTFDAAMRHRAYVGGSKSHREVFRSRADATAWLALNR